MSKIQGLIIPDVHERISKLQSILSLYPKVDWVVFLGDFMDSFDGLTSNTFATIKWLAENRNNPKYTFIFGNHDIHYAAPVEGIVCGGWTKKKQEIIKEYFPSTKDWENWKLLHWIEAEGKEWLLSHAGVHPYLLHPIMGLDKDSIKALENEALWKLLYCQTITSFVAVGKGRGGYAYVGGVDWLDWNTEFIPIPGLNQIVGHTPDDDPRKKEIENSTNYCLDTHLNHIIEIYEDGKLVIKPI